MVLENGDEATSALGLYVYTPLRKCLLVLNAAVVSLIIGFNISI